MNHPLIIGSLLGVAVGLTFLCCLGVLVMRDPYQRLHFASPVVTISSLLITVAVWIGDAAWQARLKMVCIAIILLWMNSILSHATARAIRIRKLGQLDPVPGEKITIVTEKKK